MKPVLAVIAAGGMGSAVGKRLAENGVRVLTSLEGRSAASAARAKAAGMVAASDPEIATADIVLSIVPPGEALPLAQRLAPGLERRQQETGLCRLQRREPGHRETDRRRDRANRLSVRRCRHYRRPAARGL